MSQKIKAPNEKSGGFLWGLVAIVVIAVVVIAVVVVQGRKASDTVGNLSRADANFDVSYADNTVTLKNPNTAQGAPVAEIYEDFACHVCSDLVNADHESMFKALNEGTLVVKLKFTGGVDGGEDGSSTRGAAAAIALAKAGDADAFWAYHEMAFLERTTVYGWNYSRFAEALEQLDVDTATVDAVRDGSEVKDVALSVTEANITDLQGRMDQPGTPAVFVDGTYIPPSRVDPNDSTKLKDWVPDAVKAVKAEK